MRVPISWLREYAPIPAPVDAQEVGRRLTAAGLEVEAVEQVGHDVRGVVVAQVVTIEELTEFKKPIRYCRVAVSEAELAADPATLTGVICGATNFKPGDRVAFATPGAVLPGGFEITEAKKYGRISQGMICAVDELAIGEDHSGILILPPGTPLGVDFVEYAGLRDDVLDITVTPDRGYAVSIRGVARELATAYQVPYTDPATTFIPGEDASGLPEGDDPGRPGADPVQAPWPAAIGDPTACDRFVLREVRGFDPGAPTPLWMQIRLARCGMRSISLAVDVTNYLMIELGQPLHAFDRSKLRGPIVVRRARPGETLVTLDHVDRNLYPDDILITDDSGPISLAGTMGGLATEIDDASTDIVIEGAHFSDTGTAKMSRRHRLHSEASYRFERGVDRELPPRATARAAALLASLGGARVAPGLTQAEAPVAPVTITLSADYPDRVAGVVYGLDTVVARLEEVGCAVRSTPASHQPTIAPWRAQPPDARPPPQARPSAHGPAGHPAVLASRPNRPGRPGRGGHPARGLQQHPGPPAPRHRRPRPHPSAAGAPRGRPHPRRRRVRRGPLRAVRPGRRRRPADDRAPTTRAGPRSRSPTRSATTSRCCAPPCCRACSASWRRTSAAASATSRCSRPAWSSSAGRARPRPRRSSPPTGGRPRRSWRRSTRPCLSSRQRIAGVLAGYRELPGPWGPGRVATWADAIEAARSVAAVEHVTLDVQAAAEPPFHPGRCAALSVRAGAAGADGTSREWLAGYAGELHPRVVAAFGLPERTCAFELDLAVIAAAAEAVGPVRGPALSAYPLASQDIALVVADDVPAADVAAALTAGAGELLEDVRLFDVYTGAQLGAGNKSLAYTLRLRAPDRTLTAAEATAARDAAVAEAARRTGAVLRA